MPPFRWEDIGHRLVVLKLTELAEEIRTQTKADESRIRFENRLNLNSNTVPSLILKIKVERADEYARREYEIYCSVWQTQGHVKSAAFVRAVCAHIVQMLGVRANSIASEFSRLAISANLPDSLTTAHLNSLDLRMRQLQGRWQRRLEIEAKECEHGERREKLASARVSESAVPPIETAQEASFSEKGSTRKRPGLGPKKQDLSQYLDSAKLTQRQHECMSLCFEYDLKLTEIAHRLGIDRKTVEEHLALAKAKLEKQTARGRLQRNLSKVKPGGLDM